MEVLIVVLVPVLIIVSMIMVVKVFDHALRQRRAMPAPSTPSPAATTAQSVAHEARALRRTLRADLADLERREGVS